MHHLIHLGKCLADPTTVRLLACLLVTEMHLPEIQRALRIRVDSLRPKLKMLRDCGLVEAENEGKWLRFRVAEKRRSLIERIFRDYEEEVAWDADLTAAEQYFRKRHVLP
jgi:DNA-binding transcriptional ArsR family regulator